MRAIVTMCVLAMMVTGCAVSNETEPGGQATPEPSSTVAPVEVTCDDPFIPAPWEVVAASASPTVGALDAAWVCVYNPGNEWVLTTGPAPIGDLVALQELVDGLEPANLMRPCTMELGPQYMVTMIAGDAQTRLLIDDYGCRWARIDGGDGILQGPPTLIQDLNGLAGL